MSKFLTSSTLKPDLSNLTSQGETVIQTVVGGEIVDTTTGKIKPSLLPAVSLSTISVVTDIPARDALTVEEGDMAKVTSENKVYVYDGVGWIEITSASDLNSLTDVVITTASNGDILSYNNTAGRWENSTTLTSHIGDSSVHYLETSISHNNIQDTGINSHVQIDTALSDQITKNTGYDNHVSDPTIHFSVSSIDHANIQNIGTNSHVAIDNHITSQTTKNSGYDSHVADNTLHYTVASINHNDIANSGTISHADIDTHIGNSTIHYTQAEINHNNILNKGTNTHVQIDNHIADANLHNQMTTKGDLQVYDQVLSVGTNNKILSANSATSSGLEWIDAPSGGVTDHTLLSNIGTLTHTQLETEITNLNIHKNDSAIHFTQFSIDHNNILNKGTNTHAQIDSHVNSSGADTVHEIFSNRANLRTINQNLSTTDNVQFNTINVNGGTFSSNATETELTNKDMVFTDGKCKGLIDFNLGNVNTNFRLPLLRFKGADSDPYHVTGIGSYIFDKFAFLIRNGSQFSVNTTFAGDSQNSADTDARKNIIVYPNGEINVQKSLTFDNIPNNGYRLRISPPATINGQFVSGILNEGGNQHSTTSASWTVVSSNKLKRDIYSLPIDGTCLSNIMSIRLVNYKYRNSEQERLGVIAEEIQALPNYNCCIETAPEIKMKDIRNNNVEEIHTDVPLLNQDKIFWSLVAAVQQLIKERTTKTDVNTTNISSNDADIATLQTELNTANTTITTLESRIAALEAILSV